MQRFLKEWHDTIQEQLLLLKQQGLGSKELYAAYIILTQFFLEKQTLPESAAYRYFEDISCLQVEALEVNGTKLHGDIVEEIIENSCDYATSLNQYPDHFQKIVAENVMLDEEFILREIKYNPEKKEYVWIETGLAIMAEDFKPVTWHGAQGQLAVTEYRLPQDVNWSEAGVEGNGLYPEQSDFDKMTARLPGTNSQAQGILFTQLMGMRGRYWTGTPYRLDDNRIPTDIVERVFYDGVRERLGFAVDGNGYVRGVRSL